MNPPSALHSAMSRERKPFTYTPGGLDLSEIKSERMAKRLMRNAMNEGVPQIPVQQVQSPPATSNIAVPNFNCLPVQVFPTLNLPANPKSLLRTRSHPNQPREQLIPKVQQLPQFSKPNRTENTASFYSPANNNNVSHQRPASMYEYNASPNNSNTLPRMNYGSTEPVSYLPEISYEAEYLRASPRNSDGFNKSTTVPLFKPDKPIDNEVSASVNVKLKEKNSVEDNVKQINSNLVSLSYNVGLNETTNNNVKVIDAPIKSENTASFNYKLKETNAKDTMESTKIAANSDYTASTLNIDLKTENSTAAIDAAVSLENATSINFELKESRNVDIEDFNKTALNTESPENEVLSFNVKVKQCSNVDNSIITTEIPDNTEDTALSFSFDLKKPNNNQDRQTTNETLRSESTTLPENSNIDLNFSIEPISLPSISPSFETKLLEEDVRFEDEQREVKVVKKQVKKESKSDVQNGDQNGETEAQLTVKLPTKKSAAKTETKVEVVKKQLPDGSIEEVKTTTTKTTVDGKTTIATKTETTIIPKEEEEEEEYEEEEEEQEEENGEVVVQEVKENGEDEVTEEVIVKKPLPLVQNGDNTKIVTKEEHSETTVTKKVSVVQQQEPEVEEEEEEIEEEVQQEDSKTVVEVKNEPKVEVEKEEIENDEEVEEEVIEKLEVEKEEEKVEEEEEEVEEIVQPEKEKPEEPVEVEKEEVEEEYEEAEVKVDENIEKPQESKPKDEESEYTEEEYESEKDEVAKPEPAQKEPEQQEPEKEEIKVDQKKESEEVKQEKPDSQPVLKVGPTVPLREPSIPLEKVEDVEIKPIGLASETVTKSHTQNTEIITNNEKPLGPTSTQTEYNRIENIVTVNRTTKTLDSTYEQLTQHGIPTVKTYFAPGRERVSTSPQPSKPYQPVYPPTLDQQQERRHSLLLERLSMERQVPSSDLYQNNYQTQQYNNQTYEQQRQWSQEPQAEVLTVSNVKPSTITNSQWYQQNQSKKENVLYNNVIPASPAPPSQPWNQSYLSPQPPLPPQTPIQPQAQPQPQYQPTYTDNITQDRNTTNTYQQNNYQTYTPKPTTWGSNNYSNTDTQISSTYNTQQNQYSSLNQSTTESYQKSTQQYSSSYVPPPWEQDSSYVADTSNQNYYQPPPQTTTFTPNNNQGWTPAPPKSKFSKPPPTAYIPPAPNQSFVKTVNTVEPPRVPGKKTYYSEYERRYITVPESNYIPGESKFQPQPDPSPQYYYDNNEPVETSEPQWRKELREFTEKTSQTTEQTSVKPPWEEDSKYAKPPPSSTYTPTPTWSQTLRPNSYRERSFESEYVGSQEFKTNTLGRGRPLSTFAKSNVDTIPERVRGVSVDRYNPNSYQAPAVAEHPPVQTHTLHVVPPAKSYHNPNVPAYHAQSRASAEPREQPIYPQPRQWVDARASPLQSRSFKYLQWITGTED